ncbi:MAG TPA: glycosyltransferase family 4 protein [Candidatus Acidoferrum sp.]|nr:glycosyltransferase family 4 protein [Candidatus Acidoferrum sp.]
MRILQLTPGAGAMYCGGCLRDNALVGALRGLGHEVTMVPLYLPLTLDEPDQSAGSSVFFGGLNVYLEQKSALFRAGPGWLHRVLASPRLLRWAAGRAAKTQAAEVGELTLSMLRGEAGNQARELEQLIAWARTQAPPDMISLSNALLIGLARRLKAELRAPVACALQGEDSFLDALPAAEREACWRTLAERAKEVDLFIAPSRYFSNLMQGRLGIALERLRVVPNGISLEGYGNERGNPKAEVRGAKSEVRGSEKQGGGLRVPVLGYFARMCPEKGLDTLVDAYVHLRQRGRVGELKLRVGGSCGPADAPFVQAQREKLAASGLGGEAEFHPNVDRAGKLRLLRSLSVFSVPARYSEAFGLYVIEALAAGVPVVQPRASAFPELLEATGGGVLCAPGDPRALAEAIEPLLAEPARAQALGEAGRRAVFERFSADSMARATVQAFMQHSALA